MLIPLRDKTGAVVARTLVDDDLPETITKYRWRLNSSGYVMRDTTIKMERVHYILHREVLGVPRELKCHVDHINGDRLDNRRENLRVTTASENGQNRPVKRRNGGYRGVYWHKTKKRWVANATVNYKRTQIGLFKTEEEAAQAVADWRREHMTHSTHDEVAA